MATIDSPSAMMTISAKRSAKWDAAIWNPAAARPAKSVPTTSTASERHQSAVRAGSSAKPPKSAIVGAIRNHGASRPTAHSCTGSWRTPQR